MKAGGVGGKRRGTGGSWATREGNGVNRIYHVNV